MHEESIEQENVHVTSPPEFEFTTRTNRTNRLEVLEEYYGHSTNANHPEETTVMEMKEIVLLSANVSASEDSNRTNVTVVEEISKKKKYINLTSMNQNLYFFNYVVIEPVANETVDGEIPLVVLHKAVINETTTDASPDNPETTQNVFTHLSENNDSIEVDANTTTPITSSPVNVTSTTVTPSSVNVTLTTITSSTVNVTSTTVTPSSVNVTSTTVTPSSVNVTSTTITPLSVNVTSTTITPSPVNVTSTTEKQVMNESTTSHNVENSTVPITTEYEASTTMIETTTELTTTEATTVSTTTIPADCPVLKDCPFDYCAFARKLDNRGCPTCNCLHSNKSNITCPRLTCQACLYGHYTDPNGVYIFI